MSRIGKQPVPVPTGVDVTIEGQNVSVVPLAYFNSDYAGATRVG